MAQVIAAALKDGGDPTAAIGAVRKRNTDLQAERDRLLAANGFPADALDEKPSCAKCGDTGWVGAATVSYTHLSMARLPGTPWR